MEGNIILNTLIFTRDAIFSPRRLFETISTGKFTNEIFIVFSLGAVITFLKTFLIIRRSFTFTFFTNETLNRLIVWLNNPQIYWLAAYMGYFIFIFLVFVMCRFFDKQVRFKQIALALMSLSGFGVAMQGVFYLVGFISSKNLLLYSNYLVYLWVIFLSIWVIKTTQNMSLSKAVICFLIPALPFIFTVSFVSLSPYLAWL